MIITNGIEIIFEDEFILVCKKPAGLATQTQQTRSNDMVNLLKRYLYMKAPQLGEPYLGIIHRLDQPVSGLLVFAKDSTSAATLSKQMQDKDFSKHYAAVLNGRPPSISGKLVDYLSKSATGNVSQVCSPDAPLAKKSVLNYSVISSPTTKDLSLFPFIREFEDKLTYVHIQLETGRHHQIRVQTSHIGCPILGDTKYGNSDSESKWRNISLCAYKLEFTHPTSKQLLSFSLV